MLKQVELTYSFNDLEPYIDELTMVTHYSKHHATYTANLNAAIEKNPELSQKSIEDIFIHLSEISDEALKTALRNNGGGYYNHNLYFSTLSPKGLRKPEGNLLKQIESDFGSFDDLKEKLNNAAATRFGSGWAWLSTDKSGRLSVSSSPNQDNPLIETRGEWTPILGIDVWEHAYYLKYKNLRLDYINALYSVLDWEQIANLYNKVKAS
ncbi:MAG TPA: superoxide dismutase [Clostridiales bacterium]|nr:superoxide dismutase [Clostridiales bacterium]